jgi:hypothetical protein
MSEVIYISGPSPLAIVNKAIWRGNSSPWLQSFSGKYSPTTGWSFNQKFAGLSYGQMQNLAYLYSQSGCSYTLTYDQGKATLETEDNRGNVTIDTWEIGINRTNRGVLQNPLNYAGVLAENSGDVTATQADFDTIASFVRGEITRDVADSGTGNVPGDYIDRLLNRIQNGQDSYLFDQYCLRHTTNASNRGFYNVADTNVNYIYTYANFLNEITNSGYWIFPCPNEILGALSVIFSDLELPLANFMKGALKGGTPRGTAANNRINLTTEYAIDVWTTDEYLTF